jgi:predicted negative regulator of RcsB-dependent stress response
MSLVPPAAPPPHDPANPPPPVGAEEFALKVQLFWEKNRKNIIFALGLAFGLILAREGSQWFQASRERGVQEAYAKVADRVDQLPKFAADNDGHALAGVAWLRAADDAYGKNDFKTAAAHYGKAVDSLGNVALKSRARLGAAMSQLAGGDAAGAQAALKALGADATASAPVRAEATYHLAVLSQGAGRTDEAKSLLDEVGRIEPMGLWAQRAFGLRAQIEAAQPAAAPAPSTPPAIEFKPGGK